ncbi:MAG: bifunctional demethylmenaquinone methyltransferase/2-methoxy-6-polyprenyl-1,4-benzoquinol methylase UbiE [Tannerellaceae bacterium]|jgi:demethylmenaquinone methyltransferase/2-methoxy-6-polyprenyl-1,4-benzoquinol methylase|nr:bifunctional demethylmenaquinone methyltransferase/2-methoxy-6-polyprenyl-1,4-benzoquinol methylase UbiE [Tannerellaceae bacterium]
MAQYGSEHILPYNKEERKGVQVERMFDAIAGKYDLLNRTLSLGFDKSWRKKAIRTLKPFAPETILDVATGTGDLAIALYRELNPCRVIGADLSEGMMNIGRRKAAESGCSEHVSFERQDSLSLTYPPCTFDAVTAAFGVRNFEDIAKGISEMFRVLKPGGHLVILELTAPERFPMNRLFAFYSRALIPAIGRMVSKEKKAYNYLPASIRVVPQGKVMAELLERIGFGEVKVRTFTLGVCSLYTAVK